MNNTQVLHISIAASKKKLSFKVKIYIYENIFSNNYWSKVTVEWLSKRWKDINVCLYISQYRVGHVAVTCKTKTKQKIKPKLCVLLYFRSHVK
jgi:hypothetical protein